MDTETLQGQARLLVAQKITFMVNRYVITTALPDGTPGETVAFAEQSRFKFREEVTFYRDESKRERLFMFKARQVIDLGATYDVFAADGTDLGAFRKDAWRSLLRSTWHLESPGSPPAVGFERSTFVAVLRRIWQMIPYIDALPFAWPYHFDFTRDGQPVMSVDRRLGIRDRYIVDIADPHLDRRLVIAQAVALDALQAR